MEPIGRLRPVFLDVEYTGEHGRTTLVSLALVTLEGDSLYLTLNDYSRGQVTDWLRENVIRFIDESKSVSSAQALKLVERWLSTHAGGKRIAIVSAGLLLDLVLLFELWRFAPCDQSFHYLHCLPTYLNHSGHIDLNTLFRVAGYGPDIDRDAFAGTGSAGRRHDALHDAQTVRDCFVRLVREEPKLAGLRQVIEI